jgi:hypothetical protein
MLLRLPSARRRLMARPFPIESIHGADARRGARASSIKRRWSAKTTNLILEPQMSFVTQTKAPSGLYSPGAFAVVTRTLRKLSGSPSIFDLRNLATNPAH